MKYCKTKEKIIINDKSEFNSKNILECGQIFRYKKIDENNFCVFSADKSALLKETEKTYEILSDDLDYFENFFDLKTDYSAIKNELVKSGKTMEKACKYGYGIRILNQQPFEMIISFIISANNNIKRIQTVVENLCEKCGKNMGNYFAFPTLSEMIRLSCEDLRQMGMGFRAKYLFNTVKLLQGKNLDDLKNLQTDKLIEYLQTLSGVGPKVADCIALFAYHKMDCFPVDTWVQKIYNCYFSSTFENNRTKIRKALVYKFKNLSGYAQQYLFYYKRELDKGNV